LLIVGPDNCPFTRSISFSSHRYFTAGFFSGGASVRAQTASRRQSVSTDGEPRRAWDDSFPSVQQLQTWRPPTQFQNRQSRDNLVQGDNRQLPDRGAVAQPSPPHWGNNFPERAKDEGVEVVVAERRQRAGRVLRRNLPARPRWQQPLQGNRIEAIGMNA
jgi:hypothetical protein